MLILVAGPAVSRLAWASIRDCADVSARRLGLQLRRPLIIRPPPGPAGLHHRWLERQCPVAEAWRHACSGGRDGVLATFDAGAIDVLFEPARRAGVALADASGRVVAAWGEREEQEFLAKMAVGLQHTSAIIENLGWLWDDAFADEVARPEFRGL